MINTIREELPNVSIHIYQLWLYSDPAYPAIIPMKDFWDIYRKAGVVPDYLMINGYIKSREEYTQIPKLLKRIDNDAEQVKQIEPNIPISVITSPHVYTTQVRNNLMIDHAGLFRRQMISEAIRDRGYTEMVWYGPSAIPAVRSQPFPRVF
jgi:hypothetical protein